MWIGGRRRGGASQLSAHLQKEENESVAVRELHGFAFDEPNIKNLEKALKQIEAIGYGKGTKRNIYHAILAPAYGETLTPERRDTMISLYLKQMGFEGHQYALVEHWKKGKQHFHLAVNIIHPVTGRIHELKWTKRKEWQISRELEQKLGLQPLKPKGKAAKTDAMQRGQRTGLDPRKLRKDVTQIYRTSLTTKDFVALLDKSGLTLTRGNRNQLVVVDKFGDTHGLMRLIEGAKLADLRRKFPELGKMQLRPHHELVKERKPARPAFKGKRSFINPRHVRFATRKAYRRNRTGAGFSSELGRQGFYLGRGRKTYALVDRNGDRHDLKHLLGHSNTSGLNKVFPDLPHTGLCPASDLSRYLKTHGWRSVTSRPVGHGFAQQAWAGAKGQFHRGFYKTGAGRGSSGNVSGGVRADDLLALFRHAAKRTQEKQQEQQPAPFKPMKKSGGWPEAALKDWVEWGYKNPAAFFAKWPELAAGGNGPSAG